MKTKRPKHLGLLKKQQPNGIDSSDLGSVQKIPTRSQIRLDLWAIHLKSPPAALAKALECTEQYREGTIRDE